ncbi:nucleotidyltransferase family protein [Candidatus Woesearchaeota archaeon]|nr:nucleotidyltransferase family protein [Candidatus Woesearchaeota archaeon]
MVKKQLKHSKEPKQSLTSLKKQIIPVLKRYHVKKAGIFGSYARGEQKKNSDVDILIEVKTVKFSLLDMVRLEREIEETIGKKVDLLTYRSINPLLKDYILRDEVRII